MEEYGSKLRTPAPEGGKVGVDAEEVEWLESLERHAEQYTTTAPADSMDATADEIIESLRNSYGKQTGDITIEAVWAYVSWLENKIVEYRLSGYQHKPKQ